MNDTLFPAPFDSDRDRREGFRTARGVLIGIVAGNAFWVAIAVGSIIAAVIA